MPGSTANDIIELKTMEKYKSRLLYLLKKYILHLIKKQHYNKNKQMASTKVPTINNLVSHSRSIFKGL